MTSPDSLEIKIREDLRRALAHFKYSHAKVLKIDFTADWDEETLETLESFSSRFARLSDIYIARFLRLKLRQSDPGFRGSLIDSLNLAEKLGLVESARDWARIRELRNIAAHEYSADDYRLLYAELLRLSPHLLKIEERL
jgi:hypothetical protein